MIPRWYQHECSDAMIADLFENTSINPIGALPTGSGKSIVLCMLVDGILSKDPEAEILVLSHDKRILEQDYDKLMEYFEGFNVGLYSAGLNSREICKVTVAGIQSVYDKSHLFKKVKYVIIDEAHKIPFKGSGRYRKILKELSAQCLGLTATPYRYGGDLIYGEIIQSNEASPMFNRLSYDATYGNKFNRLVDEGHLAPLIVEDTKYKMDVSKLKIIGGDFSQSDLSISFDRSNITKKAIAELLPWKEKYKKWCVFAIDTVHADHISEILNLNGISSVSIHSKSSTAEKDFELFESGKVQAAVSVEMLTTGVDIPDIDLVAMLRPTQSPVIHVQTGGRGTRPFPGKTHCAFFDFAGNTDRLGPINDITVSSFKNKKKRKSATEIYKTCSDCGTKQHPAKRKCEKCGMEFVFKESLTESSSNADIIKGKTKKNKIPKIGKHWLKVKSVSYSIKSRKGTPSCLKVFYDCEDDDIFELVRYGGKGFQKHLAENWVRFRAPEDAGMPLNLQGLYKGSNYLKKPTSIYVEFISQIDTKILDSEF